MQHYRQQFMEYIQTQHLGWDNLLLFMHSLQSFLNITLSSNQGPPVFWLNCCIYQYIFFLVNTKKGKQYNKWKYRCPLLQLFHFI